MKLNIVSAPKMLRERRMSIMGFRGMIHLSTY
jgi:hypothetical protein